MTGAMAQRTDWEIVQLESELAKLVRPYFKNASVLSKRQESAICATIERLLQKRLEAWVAWERSYWVDGILPTAGMLPESLQALSGEGLHICGRAIWSKGGSADPFWIEPFFATIRPSEDYTLRFGDAARGLATTPYGTHLRYADWLYPEQWLVVFTGSLPPGEQL